MRGALDIIDTAKRRWRRMDRLVRAMIANWISGMGVGLVCALILLITDFDGIRSLLWRSDMAIVGTLMLCAAFAFTFGGIVCAAAAMRIGSDDDDEPRGGRRYRARGPLKLAPIRVGARAR